MNRPIRAALIAVVFAAAAAAPSAAYDLIEPLPPIPFPDAGRPVAVTAFGERVYALDATHSVVRVFDADGKAVKTIGGPGAQRGRFDGPRGLAVGPNGELAVADSGNHRVQVFDADGNFVSAFGGKGSEPGKLRSPGAVAWAEDGRVFVADTGNARIEAFTKDGVFLFGFGVKGKEPGQLKEPTRVAIDASDRIYVLDRGNGRLVIYDARTREVKAIATAADDIQIDDYGFIYALDSGKGKVTELNPEGSSVGTFGIAGSGPGQMKKPAGIGLGPEGVVWVADTGNGRLQRVRLKSKLKIARVPQNLATKLLVSGPVRALNLQASAIAAYGGSLAAYLPKPQRFVTLGPDGKETLRFGPVAANPESQTKGTRSLAVSAKHGIFVADTEGGRIQRFTLAGVFQASFAEAKGLFASAKKEGRVKQPSAVVVNEAGTVYVADTATRRVSAFSPEGVYLFGFGPKIGQHELKEPSALAWDPAGFLYVLDRGLRKVFKCEPSGGFVRAWGEEGSEPGRFSEPVAIAYDGRSYVYVLDRAMARVSVFDRDGGWVTDFFSRGEDDRSLSEPSSLAIVGSELILSDPARARVLAFALRPRLAPPIEVSTKTVEGQVHLSWEPSSDPWIRRYRVYRSSQAGGPFEAAGIAPEASFKDDKVESYKSYRYRVAAEAATGEIGPLSRRFEVSVAGAFNRAPIEISTASIGNIFPSRYKWYLKNPLGSVRIINNLDVPFQNVKVSFRLKDFMDFATERVVDSIDPRQSLEVPLAATLNNRILELTEDTPIQAEISVTYFEKGREQVVSRALPLKVYSRNATTWQDPHRIANFITPNDPPVRDLGAAILLASPKISGPAAHLNDNLAIAIRLWNGLGAIGYKFLPSANNPFEKMVEDPAFPVDYTQFPRDTIRRKSGECDDMTTLMASLLEGAGVHAAVIDYPGHVAVMFDTGVDDPVQAGLPADRLIAHGGSLWVPIETTMIGAPFDEASRKALFAYQEMSRQGKAAVIDPKEGVDVYEPATLPVSDEPTESLDPAEADKLWRAASESYLKERLEFLRKYWGAQLAANALDGEAANALGILYSQHERYGEAEKEFQRALAQDPGNASLLNNLGNLSMIRGKPEEALERYAKAAQVEPADAGIWMNLVRSAAKLGRRKEVAEYGAKAVALDKELKPDVDTLSK